MDPLAMVIAILVYFSIRETAFAFYKIRIKKHEDSLKVQKEQLEADNEARREIESNRMVESLADSALGLYKSWSESKSGSKIDKYIAEISRLKDLNDTKDVTITNLLEDLKHLDKIHDFLSALGVLDGNESISDTVIRLIQVDDHQGVNQDLD